MTSLSLLVVIGYFIQTFSLHRLADMGKEEISKMPNFEICWPEFCGRGCSNEASIVLSPIFIQAVKTWSYIQNSLGNY